MPFEGATPLLTAAEMRAWDSEAIERVGIPERLLMENAGRAAACVVHALYPIGLVAAAIGKGNNGGDALVMLRCLAAWGRDVVMVAQEDGAIRDELLHGYHIPRFEPEDADAAFASAAVIVDGLLGTGATGAPRGAATHLIRAMSDASLPIVALDGPSGVDLTTGATAGVAVSADVTVSFGAPKRGHLLYPGRSHTGRLVVVEVGFPPFDPRAASAVLITREWAERHTPEIPWNAHKGTTGQVVVVAGRSGMGGAAILAAMGALRAGAGLARIVSHPDNRVVVQGSIPEAIFQSREGDGVRDAFQNADSIVIGPGMGTDADALSCLELALSESKGIVVMDADAITLLSRHPDLLAGDIGPRVLLTPHPRELGRLMEMDTDEVVADPFEAAARAVVRFGCAVLLKGAPSIVARLGNPTLVNVTGHSGVATGGMGDTLSGVAGAFAAAGATPAEAGALALHFAGRAAEIAGRGRGLLPRDVAESLPAALVAKGLPDRLQRAEVILDLPAPV
ncbi:bifunctional ADP-dependent NAD(P)H-hydrate dehydratase/NAD(P)H-hydrate epimerase [soil metagenome]